MPSQSALLCTTLVLLTIWRGVTATLEFVVLNGVHANCLRVDDRLPHCRNAMLRLTCPNTFDQRTYKTLTWIQIVNATAADYNVKGAVLAERSADGRGWVAKGGDFDLTNDNELVLKHSVVRKCLFIRCSLSSVKVGRIPKDADFLFQGCDPGVDEPTMPDMVRQIGQDKCQSIQPVRLLTAPYVAATGRVKKVLMSSTLLTSCISIDLSLNSGFPAWHNHCGKREKLEAVFTQTVSSHLAHLQACPRFHQRQVLLGELLGVHGRVMRTSRAWEATKEHEARRWVERQQNKVAARGLAAATHIQAGTVLAETSQSTVRASLIPLELIGNLTGVLEGLEGEELKALACTSLLHNMVAATVHLISVLQAGTIPAWLKHHVISQTLLQPTYEIARESITLTTACADPGDMRAHLTIVMAVGQPEGLAAHELISMPFPCEGYYCRYMNIKYFVNGTYVPDHVCMDSGTILSCPQSSLHLSVPKLRFQITRATPTTLKVVNDSTACAFGPLSLVEQLCVVPRDKPYCFERINDPVYVGSKVLFPDRNVKVATSIQTSWPDLSGLQKPLKVLNKIIQRFSLLGL